MSSRLAKRLLDCLSSVWHYFAILRFYRFRQAQPSRWAFSLVPTMTRSTSWSCLALSLALISYVMHRDISANIFLATFFIIQGLRGGQLSADHRDRVSVMLIILSAGIAVFATWCLLNGIDLGKPKPFGSRIQ